MRFEALRVATAAAMLAAGASGASGQPIVGGAGGDLQGALKQAQPGQVVQLQAGATFDGNFVLPVKTGTAYITVRTSTPDGELPGSTTRADPPDVPPPPPRTPRPPPPDGGLPGPPTPAPPSYEPKLATIRSINALPALRTAAGA